MVSDQNYLLPLLNAGIEVGAFAACDAAIVCDIRQCATGLMTGLQMVKASGYEVDTYLISFPQLASIHGLVLKVIPTTSEGLIKVTEQECVVLRQMGSQSEFIVPRFLAAFEVGAVRVLVTEMLSGTIATNLVLTRDQVVRIARSIHMFQQGLGVTGIGQQKCTDVQLSETVRYYGPKLSRFMETHCNLAILPTETAFLDTLEPLRRACRTIVSDRSPTNIILDGTRIGMFDFGLLLVGVPFEDWSWFIDDPRLVSYLTREELVKAFCEGYGIEGHYIQDSSDVFHHAAFFVCAKQYCLMRNAGRKDMANHYLNRARESAMNIPSPDVRLLVQKFEPAS